jgi:predicted TIM-barrel fold metal-dependent hydrolase
MNSNEEWLLTNKEKAIEPNLPICDPHHHLWDFNKTYIEETYLLPDILKDTNSGHNIISTVFIECGAMYNPEHTIEEQVINETEFVNGIAAMNNSGLYGKTKIAEGIVGSAPLLIGDKVANILDKHLSVAPNRFKGIRSQAAMHPDGTIPSTRARPIEGVYINDMFHQGFSHLESRNLSFEAWCYHPQLPQLIQLAKKFPNTTIILNHFGGPLGIGSFTDKEEETYSFWKKQITELSKCENVVAKLGGIAMEINGFKWHLNKIAPSGQELINRTQRYYEKTIELFGVDRCMFESNFPVDKISCSYVNLWNGFKLLTKDYSPDERAKLFHDNATRIYKL